MNQAYLQFIDNLNVFLLVLVRCTGLFVIAPIFGRRSIPVYFKVGFSFFIALIMMHSIPTQSLGELTNIWAYTAAVFREFMVGLLLGYVGYLVFAGIYMAGQIIDMQIGFGVVNVLDPISNTQVPISSNVYYTIAMLLFLSMKGHYLIIRALFQSYSIVPLNGLQLGSGFMQEGLILFGSLFLVGLKIAAPVIAAVFVADISLGIISKTVPQLNIFVVGMPLKIGLGLILMVITIPSFSMIVEFLIRGMDTEMYEFLKWMGGRS